MTQGKKSNAPEWSVNRIALAWAGVVSVTLAVSVAAPVRANLIINPTYDPTVTSLTSGSITFAQVKSAFEFAAAQFQNTLPTISRSISMSPPVRTFQASAECREVWWPVHLRPDQKLSVGRQTSAADTTAVASLGPTDPTGGGQFWLTRAESKALGQLLGTSVVNDGTFTFKHSDSFTFDPTHRAVSGKIDFIGIAEHEISEVMGRAAGLTGLTLGGKPAYLPTIFSATPPPELEAST